MNTYNESNQNKQVNEQTALLRQVTDVLSSYDRNMMVETLSSSMQQLEKVFRCIESDTRVVMRTIDELSSVTRRISDAIIKTDTINSILAIADNIARKVGDISDIALSDETIRVISGLQASSIAMLTGMYPTSMICELRNAVVNLDYDKCIAITEKALQNERLEAADVAYFKYARSGKIISGSNNYPKGFSSFLKNLNQPSAASMAYKNKFYYDVNNQSMVVTESPNGCFLDVATINVICSATEVFDNSQEDELFTEEELGRFVSVLAERMSTALADECGQKIERMLCSFWDKNIYKHGLDRDCFYHSRARDAGTMPYPNDVMLQAPMGVVGPGRYNHPGKSHFYFSDTIHGAEMEVSKHCAGKIVQTVKLRPIIDVTLLDLSGSLRRGKTFLQYMRYPADSQEGLRPRAYLLPSFVADICKMIGFEGIKYSGSKEYYNYVTWRDNCFEIVESL